MLVKQLRIDLESALGACDHVDALDEASCLSIVEALAILYLEQNVLPERSISHLLFLFLLLG